MLLNMCHSIRSSDSAGFIMKTDNVCPVLTMSCHKLDLIGVMVCDGYILNCQLEFCSGKQWCLVGWEETVKDR